MTMSRSFAPAEAQPAEAGPLNTGAVPPVFPFLPYAYMAYADHCRRDYADYVGRLVHAEEPWGAEDGLQMLSDMNQAFFQLVWAPFGSVMAPPRP